VGAGNQPAGVRVWLPARGRACYHDASFYRNRKSSSGSSIWVRLDFRTSRLSTETENRRVAVRFGCDWIFEQVFLFLKNMFPVRDLFLSLRGCAIAAERRQNPTFFLGFRGGYFSRKRKSSVGGSILGAIVFWESRSFFPLLQVFLSFISVPGSFSSRCGGA
jgi:hypothetical protein